MTNSYSFQSAQSENGFNLIELVIVVAIIGILAAIAIPSYSGYITRSNRSDATKALITLSNLQEQYYIANQVYASDIANLPINSGSENNHYLLSVTAGNTASFTLNASPVGTGVTGRQSSDGAFSLNSVGLKRWDCNNDNTYSCSWDEAARQNK
ncbi:MAG: type IV pilus assembly protein PilE [Arenicella sp.]|jgi:type IV pilus assembly protein PilE